MLGTTRWGNAGLTLQDPNGYECPVGSARWAGTVSLLHPAQRAGQLRELVGQFPELAEGSVGAHQFPEPVEGSTTQPGLRRVAGRDRPARAFGFVVTQIPPARFAPSDVVERALDAAYVQAREVREGRNAQVYPALAEADPELFGLSLVATDGRVWDRGDAEAGFAFMSVAKPFTFALVAAHLGAGRARDELGVAATGAAFNAVEPVLAGDGRTNPMVNAGAIAACSRLPGASGGEKLTHLLDGLSAFAGRRLAVNEELYENVMATNVRNRELTEALTAKGQLVGDPEDALVLYTMQSCLWVNAHDLAVMGATLANGGVNPVTGVRVIGAELIRPVLAVMITAGLYELSGEWLYDVALPAKTGLGGGIVTVAPGLAGIGGFSPPIDAGANTVRGVRATAQVAADLGLGLFG